MAEGVGFEPTIRFPVYTLSKRAPSATRPSLHNAAPRSAVRPLRRRAHYSHRVRTGKALSRHPVLQGTAGVIRCGGLVSSHGTARSAPFQGAAQTAVTVEQALTIFLNSQQIVTAMTINDYPEHLARGHLLDQNTLAPPAR